MDPLPPKTPADQPVTAENFAALSRQYQRLEKLFALALASLIVVVFSINIYFSRAAKLFGQQSANLEQNLKGLAQTQPLIRDFATAMQQYAATDKDFAPIWERYRPAFAEFLGQPKGTGPATNSAPGAAKAPLPKK